MLLGDVTAASVAVEEEHRACVECNVRLHKGRATGLPPNLGPTFCHCSLVTGIVRLM
jgi:hypothetical protein